MGQGKTLHAWKCRGDTMPCSHKPRIFDVQDEPQVMQVTQRDQVDLWGIQSKRQDFSPDFGNNNNPLLLD